MLLLVLKFVCLVLGFLFFSFLYLHTPLSFSTCFSQFVS